MRPSSAIVGVTVTWVLALASVATAQTPGAAEQLNAPGPEARQLAQDVGTWEVTATIQPTPDAKPIVTPALVAERSLIGNYLEEVMKPGPGSSGPAFERIDYLTFNRWKVAGSTCHWIRACRSGSCLPTASTRAPRRR